MHGLTTLIFDWDGTLIDSKPGIMRCLAETIEAMHAPALPYETMLRFIGPPFQDSMQRYCGFSEAKALGAREIFCARYESSGLSEASIVPGAREMLLALRENGCRTAIASSKPQAYCMRQLEHFKMDNLMDAVVGSGVSGDLREEKSVLIADALRLLGVSPERAAAEACMIGDRKFDAEGASALGLSCVGFSPCGYGSDEELWGAGCVAVLHTVRELTAYLLERVKLDSAALRHKE